MDKKRTRNQSKRNKKRRYHTKQKPAPKNVLMLPPNEAPFICREKGSQKCMAFCANRTEENQCYLSTFEDKAENKNKKKRSFFKWKTYNSKWSVSLS